MLVNAFCHDFFILPVNGNPFEGRFVLIAFLIIYPCSGHIKEVKAVFCEHLYTFVGQVIAAQSVIFRNIHIIDPIVLDDRAVEIAFPYGGDGIGFCIQTIEVMILFGSAKIDAALIDTGWIGTVVRRKQLFFVFAVNINAA